jgi:hypothetical protein
MATANSILLPQPSPLTPANPSLTKTLHLTPLLAALTNFAMLTGIMPLTQGSLSGRLVLDGLRIQPRNVPLGFPQYLWVEKVSR